MIYSDDLWNANTAAVVCRMLGYEGDAEPTQRNYISDANFIMDNVVCSGHETDLAQCQHDTTHDCGRYEAAGVVCHDSYSTSLDYDVTLAGERPGEGAVLINGRPVCDDLWDDDNANVVCRQLGYTGGSALQRLDLNSLGITGNFILDNVQCSGYETDIMECSANPMYDHDCSRSEGAGVKCERIGIYKYTPDTSIFDI